MQVKRRGRGDAETQRRRGPRGKGLKDSGSAFLSVFAHSAFNFRKVWEMFGAIRFLSAFHSTGSMVLHIDPLLPWISSLP